MHRRDIDGLRAIAVLSVVLFHLGFFPAQLGGGFVGVDVFFVISGYLITGLLQNDIDSGRFDLLEFYHRRVRRIFPALFVVYGFCLVASALLLFPAETRSVGQEVLWSLGFLSNVAFAKAGGYFDQSSKSAPLLHTWSLSVEEQFYVAFPLLLLLLSRLRAWLRLTLLALLAALSCALSIHLVSVDARSAFYLVQSRAWELLVGSLLALAPALRLRGVLEVLGFVGLGLIAFSVYSFGNTTPFPGYWALVPCAGAAALLYSGRDSRTLTARLLGILPLRWVGLVSYSLYLWHWPLITFYSARHDELSLQARFAILGLSLLLATLSYHFVERPFRAKPYRRSARAALRIAGVGVACIAGLALGIPTVAAKLHPQSELADTALGYLNYKADTRSGTCFLNSGFDDAALFRSDLCLQLDPKRKNFLIMGDSHAAHFAPAMAGLHPEIHFLQATASGCAAARQVPGPKRCTRLFSSVFDEFLPQHHVDAVVLAGRWPAQGLAPLEKTIAYLKPYATRIIVLGPVVEYDQPFPQLLARSITESDPGLPARHLISSQNRLDRRYAERLADSGAEYYSIIDATCPRGDCTLWATPAVPMHYDNHHFTLKGAELVLDRLGPRLFR
ncbi:MAG TPA: acyltransferase family protein [Polyangiaceae bacterium]|nr:acyltransferase family protein [Polyangiaceae bacterium]